MKLITEIVEEIEYITEAKSDGEKDHYIHGIFLQSELKNKNGRIYPEHVMDQETSRYIKESINQNRAYGELNHPATPSINLDRVSHIITELKKDGKNYIGKAKIVETPMGNIVKGLLKSGANLGVSSRAVGTLKPRKDGIMEVQNDFRLSTAADIVADPSAPNAFVKGIMENVDWVYDSATGAWQRQELLEKTKKRLKKMTMDEIEQNKFAIFEHYLRSFSSKSKVI